MSKPRQRRRGWLVWPLAGALLGVSLFLGCKKSNENKKGETPVRNTVDKQAVLEKKIATMVKDAKIAPEATSASWMNHVLNQSGAIPAFFAKDASRRSDLASLWGNKWTEALEKFPAPKTLVDGHAAVRARIFLRTARFYRAAYRLASDLNLGRLMKRASRAKKIKAGKLFHYYLGRQQCMSNYLKKAVESFAKALKEVPANRKDRVSLWLAVCDPAKKADAKIKAIDALAFANDADGHAERWLAARMFRLKVQLTKPPATAARATFFYQLLGTSGKVATTPLLKGIVESEEIKEGEIVATLDYYDPGVLWALSRHAARRALTVLAAVSKEDRFAPFYRAQAYRYLGDTKAALAALDAFEKQPPKGMDLAYMLFSRRSYVGGLKAEAAILRAVWEKDAKKSIAALTTLSKKPYPFAALAQLHLLERSKAKDVKESAYRGLLVGVTLARNSVKSMFIKLTKATEGKTPKGATDAQKAAAQAKSRAATALIKWQVHRYAVRSLFLWAVRGALAKGDVERAVRWAELLHRKDTPYELGGRNEAYQFILTGRAYIMAGKMGIATLYFAKSKKMYPALTQLWSLLRILRIYRGTESGSVIMMPKGG